MDSQIKAVHLTADQNLFCSVSRETTWTARLRLYTLLLTKTCFVQFRVKPRGQAKKRARRTFRDRFRKMHRISDLIKMRCDRF